VKHAKAFQHDCQVFVSRLPSPELSTVSLSVMAARLHVKQMTYAIIQLVYSNRWLFLLDYSTSSDSITNKARIKAITVQMMGAI
jgi:hypothetical protein